MTKTATPEMTADEAMKRIWTDWLAYHNAQFSGRKYYITAADQMAFYEIAQPIMRSLAASPPPAVEPVAVPLFENDAIWARFYRGEKNLGEICAEFGLGVYDLSPWLTAPLMRSVSTDLREENERLKEEIGLLEDELDDAKQEPWPEWASAVVEVIREYTGYDGYDDATDGIDMPAELSECLSELHNENERQTAKAATLSAENTALRETLEKLKRMAMLLRGEQAYREFPKAVLNAVAAALSKAKEGKQ